MKTTRQPFNPLGEFVTSKSFRFHGRYYGKGYEFPWRQLACSERRLRELFDAKYVELKEGSTSTEKPTPPVEPEKTQAPEKPKGIVFNPDVHKVKKKGRKWYVMLEDEYLARITYKEAKRLNKRATSTEVRPKEIVEE